MVSFWDNYQSKIREMLSSATAKVAGEMHPVDSAIGVANEWVTEVKQSGRYLFFIGNGASAAFASHMAADWTKHGGVPSLTLTDAAMLTATANDYSYSESYSKPLEMLSHPGDMLVTISSSGASPNIVEAIDFAKRSGMKVVSFSGFSPENLSLKNADMGFYVPANHYGIVECVHQVMLHAWLDSYSGSSIENC